MSIIITLDRLRSEFKRRGFPPVNAPVVAPVGNAEVVIADDGRGCALLLFRQRTGDEFWRIPWAALDAGRALDR